MLKLYILMMDLTISRNVMIPRGLTYSPDKTRAKLDVWKQTGDLHMSFSGRKFGASVSINHKSVDAGHKQAKKEIVIGSLCELLTMIVIRIAADEVHLSQTKNC